MRYSEFMETQEDEWGVCWATQRELIDPEIVAFFRIPGEPKSKARPRYDPRRKRMYTPRNTVKAEQAIGWAFRAVAGKHKPSEWDSYGVFAHFYCKTRQRRDVDNMTKAVLDGLNGLAWVDDSQVSEITARVRRGSVEAETVVLVYRTQVEEAPSSICEQCGAKFKQFKSTGKRRFCSGACRSANLRDRRMRKCQECGNEFDDGARSGSPSHCSVECFSRSRTVTLKCCACGKSFEKTKSWVKNPERSFCSDECRASVHSVKRPKGECQECGGPVSRKEYVRCRACALRARSMTTKTARERGQTKRMTLTIEGTPA